MNKCKYEVTEANLGSVVMPSDEGYFWRPMSVVPHAMKNNLLILWEGTPPVVPPEPNQP